MWSIIGMGSVESKLKGSYGSAPFSTLLVGSLGPINPDKQFPNFKSNPSALCRHHNNMEQTNSSPGPHDSVTKSNVIVSSNPLCNRKKKKRRRRRKKKNKTQKAQPTLCVSTEIVVEKCNNRRQRQLSTASEDSFVICFEEENEQISDLSDNETETVEDFDSSDSIVAHKKVRFADDSELCQVHPMVMWAYAYQAARKGPWEEYARDRDRFHKRVMKIEAEIGHVFAPEHRAKIFNERFA